MGLHKAPIGTLDGLQVPLDVPRRCKGRLKVHPTSSSPPGAAGEVTPICHRIRFWNPKPIAP